LENNKPNTNDKKLKFDGLVMSIMGLTALTNSAYAIIAPFLPFKFEEKGIDAGWIGYVFSSYSIAVIVFSPLCGSFIRLTGRINLIIIGINLMGFSFIAFGLISSIKDEKQFIILSLLARFLQGMASGLL
jgi:MFS family permease